MVPVVCHRTLVSCYSVQSAGLLWPREVAPPPAGWLEGWVAGTMWEVLPGPGGTMGPGSPGVRVGPHNLFLWLQKASLQLCWTNNTPENSWFLICMAGHQPSVTWHSGVWHRGTAVFGGWWHQPLVVQHVPNIDWFSKSQQLRLKTFWAHPCVNMPGLNISLFIYWQSLP